MGETTTEQRRFWERRGGVGMPPDEFLALVRDLGAAERERDAAVADNAALREALEALESLHEPACYERGEDGVPIMHNGRFLFTNCQCWMAKRDAALFRPAGAAVERVRKLEAVAQTAREAVESRPFDMHLLRAALAALDANERKEAP